MKQPENYRLSEHDLSYQYQLITSEILTAGTVSDHPIAIMLGGQPGSGKTKMRDLATDELPSVVINADDLREFHPAYKKLKLLNPDRASFLVNEDVSMWTRQLINQSIAEKRNVVFDFTFGISNKDVIKKTLTDFKDNGYESQLWILAVPAEISKLGIYLRNEMQIKRTGMGRFVSMKVHDLNFRNIPDNLDMVVKNSLVDKVCIFSRSIELINGEIINNKVNNTLTLRKTDAEFTKAAEFFVQMRNEPFSKELKEYFSFHFNGVVSMIDDRLIEAKKENDLEKANAISLYKEQLYKNLGIYNNIETAEKYLKNKQGIAIDSTKKLKESEISIKFKCNKIASEIEMQMPEKTEDSEQKMPKIENDAKTQTFENKTDEKVKPSEKLKAAIQEVKNQQNTVKPNQKQKLGIS